MAGIRIDRLLSVAVFRPLHQAGLTPQGFRLPILMYHSISEEREPGVSAYYKTNTSPVIFGQHIRHLAEEGYRALTLHEGLEILKPTLTRPEAGLPSSEGQGNGVRIPRKDISRIEPMNRPLTRPGGHPLPRGGEGWGEGARFMGRGPSKIRPGRRFTEGMIGRPGEGRLMNEAKPSCPSKLVVLTFDDGFRNFYTEAFPVLQKHGFTATVFLPTAFVQTARTSFKNTECHTWEEVRELRKKGIHFGSHTVNHPRLTDLSWVEVEREVRDSKIQLEQQLSEPITTFAYPFAFPQADRSFARAFRNLLAEHGYACCATTELGRMRMGDDPYRLKRLPANSLDDPSCFRAKLEGGYDWLAFPQALVKRFKHAAPASRKRDDIPVQTPETILH